MADFKNNLTVVIPVFNEINTIGPLLDKVMAVPIVREIIIVDDKSSDGTREFLISLRKKLNFKLVFNDKNQGKGASIRNSLKYITGHFVIIQDADLEYDPEDYNRLMAEVSDNSADVVFGSRFISYPGKMLWKNMIGNKILTALTNLLYGSRLTDMETCYKLMPSNFFKNANLCADHFDFEPEITSKILKAGLKIREVAISYKCRSIKEGKKIGWKDGLMAIVTLLKYRFFVK